MGFEPAISLGERPQTCALDRAATGTGWFWWWFLKIAPLWSSLLLMTVLMKWLPLKHATDSNLYKPVSDINRLERVRTYNNMVTDILCYPRGSWIVSKKMAVSPLEPFNGKILRIYGPRLNTHSAISDVLTKSMIIRTQTTRGNTCWTEKNGMGSTHLQYGWTEFTTENLRRNYRLYSNRPVGKPKNCWTDAVTRWQKTVRGHRKENDIRQENMGKES
jgi:hypothetical protein